MSSGGEKILWVDKYRVETFDHFLTRASLTHRLQTISLLECGHIILHGPCGSGRRSRVRALLHYNYGEEVFTTMTTDNISFNIKTNTVVNEWEIDFSKKQTTKKSVRQIPCILSKYHMEICLTDVLHTEKDMKSCVSAVLSHFTQTQRVSAFLQASSDEPLHRTIVVYRADELPMGVLVRFLHMERSKLFSCRLIFICQNISKLSRAFKSRCTHIRIPAPTDDEINLILQHISTGEHVELKVDWVKEILCPFVKRNLSRAILIVETIVRGEFAKRSLYEKESSTISLKPIVISKSNLPLIPASPIELRLLTTVQVAIHRPSISNMLQIQTRDLMQLFEIGVSARYILNVIIRHVLDITSQQCEDHKNDNDDDDNNVYHKENKTDPDKGTEMDVIKPKLTTKIYDIIECLAHHQYEAISAIYHEDMSALIHIMAILSGISRFFPL